MKTVEISSKSVEGAIEEYLATYKIEREELIYEIVEEGSKGFLNLIGNKPAVVKFTLPGIDGKIRKFLTELFSRIEIQYEDILINHTSENDQDIYSVEITGVAELGFLIGKDGRFLDSIQHLTNRHANTLADNIRVTIDAADYRKKQDRKFLLMIKDAIENVKRRKKAVTLEPMDAAQRRRVHQYVKRDKELHTLTTGNGEFKRVAILPVKHDKEKYLSTSQKGKRQNEGME
ncbi:MAG: Jag N-terminal domain-containing protein [Candidatus Cloacimonetes bacterium]|nr:Jag N-terminal domain-containing protein [Candidatus Cloacimonadota bacterium]